jgi:energy-coupling factor transport system ATP-binding protein
MIELRDVTFTPAGSDRPTLREVSLDIGPGERVGIVGPSGSGKSTLGYHLCGAHRLALAGTTSGGIVLDGRDCLAGGPPGFAGLVGQNPEAQLFCRTVQEEVLLGPRMRGEDEAVCLDRARGLMARHGLASRAEMAVTKLSLGQKQLTAILSMLSIEPKVLLLDEPTSYLDTDNANRVFEHLDSLSRKRGWIVLVIEHDLARLSGFADRYLSLADGRLTSDGSPRAPGCRCHRHIPATCRCREEGRPLVSLSGLSFAYARGKPVLEDIDLTVRPGECLALTGPNGSGKSTLLRLIKGLVKPAAGEVRLGAGLTGPRDVGLMLQNPEEQIFAHTVEAECGYWLCNLGLPPGERDSRVREVLGQLGLGEMLARTPFSLSFGEKRRLCLAAILVAEPTVLCLDEPTTGLDDANMEAMAAMVKRQAEAGKAVIVATHEEAFADMTATRRIRLEAGRIVADQACVAEAV